MTTTQLTNRTGQPGRPLVWAAAVAVTYAAVMTLVGLGCANFLTRPDNQGALAATFACSAVLVLAQTRGDAARLWGQLPAGILAGLYLQPSTAFLVTLFVGFMAVRNALTLRSRPIAFGLLTLGVFVGVGLMFGLMSLISPSDLRC